MPGYKVSSREENIAHLHDNRSGPAFLKLESGAKGRSKKTWIRILPTLESHPNGSYYLWVRTHFSVGANNRSVGCLQPFDKVCPVCAEVQRLEAEGFKKEASDMYGKYRALMNVMEYDEDGTPIEEVKVWSVGRDTMNALTDKIGDEVPDDPDNGFDIGVSRRGVKMDEVRYDCELSDDNTVLLGGDYAELLEGLYDLTQVYPPLESERLLTMLAPVNTDLWDDAPDELPAVEAEYREIEAPRSASRPARSSRAPVEPPPEEVPEEVPEEEEPPDDEAQAEAAPLAARGARPQTSTRGSAPSRGSQAAAPARGARPAPASTSRRGASTPAPSAARGSAPSTRSRSAAAEPAAEDPQASRRRLEAVLNAPDVDEVPADA